MRNGERATYPRLGSLLPVVKLATCVVTQNIRHLGRRALHSSSTLRDPIETSNVPPCERNKTSLAGHIAVQVPLTARPIVTIPIRQVHRHRKGNKAKHHQEVPSSSTIASSSSFSSLQNRQSKLTRHSAMSSQDLHFVWRARHRSSWSESPLTLLHSRAFSVDGCGRCVGGRRDFFLWLRRCRRFHF